MSEIWYESEYTDHRFGFPVTFLNAPMKKVHGHQVLFVNGNILRNIVMLALCVKLGPLTGSEVRSIRRWRKLTLAAFGAEFGISHVAVKKWEDRKEKVTGTHRANDVYIRLLVLEKLLEDGEIFKLSLEPSTPYALTHLLELVSNEREKPSFLAKLRNLLGWKDPNVLELFSIPVSKLSLPSSSVLP